MARRALKFLAMMAVGFSGEAVITNDFGDGTQMYKECSAEGKNKTKVDVEQAVAHYDANGFILPQSLSDDCNGMSFYCTRKDENNNLICDWCVNSNGAGGGVRIFNYDPDQFWNRADAESNTKGAAFKNACGMDDYIHCTLKENSCNVATVQETIAAWIHKNYPDEDFKAKFEEVVTAVIKVFRDNANNYVEGAGGGKLGRKKNQIKQLFRNNKARLAKCADSAPKPLSAGWCSKRNLAYDTDLGVCAPRANMFVEVKTAFSDFFHEQFAPGKREDFLDLLRDTLL